MKLVAVSMIALAACAQSLTGETTSNVEVGEDAGGSDFGVCGANADPVPGVKCDYRYQYLGGDIWGLSSFSTFEQNGLTYAQCTWDITCSASGDRAISDDGRTCVKTIGVGCSAQTRTGTILKVVQLPPGTSPDGVQQVCIQNRPQYDLAVRGYPDAIQACADLSTLIDQPDDQCCVSRTQAPLPHDG